MQSAGSLDFSKMKGLADPVLADKVLVQEHGMLGFIERAWKLVEPGSMIGNWHIDAICEHLQATIDLQIRDLLICVPPGASKSLLVNVFFPAFVWTVDPALKFISASYGQGLSDKSAHQSLSIIRSPWYQARWGGEGGAGIDKENMRRTRMFENVSGGFRFSTSTGGEITGRHGDFLIADDLNKAQDSESAAAIQKAVDFWEKTMPSRRSDPQTTRRIVIQQRLHFEDVPAKCLQSGDYTALILPMRYEPKRMVTTPLGFNDPRKKEGELLCPKRFPNKEVDDFKKVAGPLVFESQFQQRPSPPGGLVFKRSWFKFWGHPDSDRHKILPPKRFLQYGLSWDLAFKGTPGADRVCGLVWAQYNADFLLVDCIAERLSFTETLDAFIEQCEKYPLAVSKYVEDKANGPAVIDALQGRISGIIAVTPQGGKEARAHAAAPIFRSGNVYLPHPSIAPWVEDYMQELLQFPVGAHDDQVDATTQYLIEETQGASVQEISAGLAGLSQL